MTAFIVTIHVIVSIALILIVLLQTGKGANMGAVFGGAGSQALFGNTGAATFLSKMTTVAAVVFMITSLSLAYISKSGGKSVVSDIKPALQETQPAEPVQQPQPPSEETLPLETPAAVEQPTEVPAAVEQTMTEVAPMDDAASPSAVPTPAVGQEEETQTEQVQ